MTESSEERSRFENAMRNNRGRLRLAALSMTRLLDNVYADKLVQAAWEGWRARAELAVPAEGGEAAPEKPCVCICHKVGLFGLMCCPCTTKILEDFVGHGATLEIRNNYVSGAIPADMPAVAPAQTPEEVAQDAARRLLAGVKSVIADPAQTLAYFNAREDLLAGRREKEGK